MKHIAVFTSSRSDWGILATLVRSLRLRDNLRTTIVASGSHFDPRFGNTIDVIAAEHSEDTVHLNAGPVGNSPHEACMMASRLNQLISGWFEESSPDAIIILGDRFEALACALAAVVHRVSIIHLHGGEITTGAIDDSVRHAISKLARLHFPVHQDYERRLVQMGESQSSIIVSGSLAVEGIEKEPPYTKSELRFRLKLAIPDSFVVCAVHPVTTSATELGAILDTLEQVLPEHSNLQVFLTAPAPDPGFEEIERRFRRWCSDHPGIFTYRSSLGSRNLLSLVRYSSGLIGNSSSGLLEVPSLGVPTLNIGSRQEGRVRATSVLDAQPNVSAVRAALNRMMSPKFQQSARQAVNPIAGKHPSRVIINVIEETDFSELGPKFFHDMDKTS